MPRKPEKTPEYLEEELKKFPIFNNKRELKGEDDSVWKEIKKTLELKMAAKSIYLHVYNDRHGCKSNLLNYFFHLQPVKQTIKRKTAPNTDPDFLCEKETSNPYNCETLVFEIVLPATVIFNDNYETKEGWQHEVRSSIYGEKQLPCAFGFKTDYLTIDRYFKFSGFCGDCYSSINGESCTIVDLKENITITIKAFSNYSIPHSKKSKISGPRRKKMKEILRYKRAIEHREDELEKLETNYEPPDLNTTEALRKVREEAIDEYIEYKQFKGLSMSNKEFRLFCNIQKLCFNPFYVWYWSEKQVELWNILQDQVLPLSFDATGSLVKKYTFGETKSKTIFYYVMVIGIAGKVVPLLQALSSAHHVIVLKELLDRWLNCGAKVPKEIVTDRSATLQNAICLSFNSMTYKMYNLSCYKILLNEPEDLPNCYYRIDVAHLLNSVRHWKSFKDSNPNIISFYLRCIGYLSQVDSIEKFVEVATSIIIVSNSTVIDDDSECSRRKASLINLFKTFKKELDDLGLQAEDDHTISKAEGKDTFDDEDESEYKNEKDKLTFFIDKIFEKSLSLSCLTTKISEKANFYYCPDFINNFKMLCYTFPSWTNTMMSFFGSTNEVATSARSETYFKNVKMRIPYPILIPKFLLRDRKKIKSLINFAFMHLPKEKDEKEREKEKDDFLLVLNLKDLPQNAETITNEAHQKTDLVIFTNETKNKQELEFQSLLQETVYPKFEQKNNILDSIDNITVSSLELSDGNIGDFNKEYNISTSSPTPFAQDNSIFENRNLIKNGLRISHKTYNIRDALLTLKFINTCPFDSIFEIFVTAYVQNNYLTIDVSR